MSKLTIDINVPGLPQIYIDPALEFQRPFEAAQAKLLNLQSPDVFLWHPSYNGDRRSCQCDRRRQRREHRT